MFHLEIEIFQYTCNIIPVHVEVGSVAGFNKKFPTLIVKSRLSVNHSIPIQRSRLNGVDMLIAGRGRYSGNSAPRVSRVSNAGSRRQSHPAWFCTDSLNTTVVFVKDAASLTVDDNRLLQIFVDVHFNCVRRTKHHWH